MKVITFSPDGQLEKKGERTDTLFTHSQQAAVNSLGEITQIKKTLGQTKGDQCDDKGRSLRSVRIECTVIYSLLDGQKNGQFLFHIVIKHKL